MARKKTSEPKPKPEAGGPEEKPVRLYTDKDTHRKLRMLAADDGSSMASFARKTLERVVNEEFARRGLR